MLQLAEEEAGEIRRAAELDAQAVREQTDAEERALLERRLRERDAAANTHGTAATSSTDAAPAAPPAPVLSFAQERLWLLGELTPGLAAYNTTRVVRTPPGAIRLAARDLDRPLYKVCGKIDPHRW